MHSVRSIGLTRAFSVKGAERKVEEKSMSRVLGGSRKKWIAALFVSGWICSLPIAAAEAAVPKMDKALPCFDEGSASDKPETPRMRDKEEFSSGGRLGGGMHSWRQMHEVFRAQPEESRQRLMLLMRENPREFHKEMQTLFIAHQKQKHAEFEAFAALVERCRSCRDDAEKDQQIAELRKIVHAQFLRQLKDHAANLEEMRKKLEALEKQYKFRAEHVDKIVDARLWSLLEHGALPPPPSGRGHFEAPPPPPPPPPLPPLPEKEGSHGDAPASRESGDIAE